MDFSNVIPEDIDGDGDGKDDIISLEGASPKSMPQFGLRLVLDSESLCRPSKTTLRGSIRNCCTQLRVAGDAVPNQSSQADDPGAVEA